MSAAHRARNAALHRSPAKSAAPRPHRRTRPESQTEFAATAAAAPKKPRRSPAQTPLRPRRNGCAHAFHMPQRRHAGQPAQHCGHQRNLPVPVRQRETASQSVRACRTRIPCRCRIMSATFVLCAACLLLNAPLLALMHASHHDLRNAPSTGHYISHNSLHCGPLSSPPPTQISRNSYQRAENFRNLTAHPCVHPCDGELRRSIIETTSGSRARFHRALRPPLSEDHSLAAPSFRVSYAHTLFASGP